MAVTRQMIRDINADIEKALQSVAEKHGVKISLGSSSYTHTDFTTKVKVETPEAEGANKEKNKQYAELLGLPTDIVGRTISLQGKNYEVIRLDIGKPKNPVIIQLAGSDKTYKVSVETAKRSLK